MTPAPAAGSAAGPAAGGRAWWAAGAGSVALLALVGALGDSAAVPGLGPATAGPPWDAAAHAPSWLVSALLAVAYLLGAAAVALGLRAIAAGYRPSPRAVALAGAAAVAVLVVVPPAGSADHLSYVAYGRIAAAGDDPYAVLPIEWRGGHDPVAGAVQPPWQRTPSVYGPVASAAFALVAVVGGGSLRPTIWCWQLLCGAAFLLVAALLAALARRWSGGQQAGGPGSDGGGGARVAVLWTLNPLLLGQLVLGVHVDVVAVALAVAGLAVACRAVARPGRLLPPPGLVAAGALLGAAIGTKAPYGLFGLAALWALRALPPRRRIAGAAALAAGALAVLVPVHVWAGPHVLDQLRRAGRFTSLATPWRGAANLVDLVAGPGTAGGLVVPVALALTALLAWRLGARLAVGPGAGPRLPAGPGAVRVALALTAAWVLLAPYGLPWYDAMVWAPLALVPAAGPLLDRLLLARLAVLALAYVPGRVVGLGPGVEAVTLGFRRYVAPVLVLMVIVAVVRLLVSACGPDAGPPRRRPPAVPAR